MEIYGVCFVCLGGEIWNGPLTTPSLKPTTKATEKWWLEDTPASFFGTKKRPIFIFSTLNPGFFVNTGKVRSMMNCLGVTVANALASRQPNKHVVARKRCVFAQSECSSWKFLFELFIVFFFWLCFLFLLLVSIGLCFSPGFVELSRWLQQLMFYYSCWEISCDNWKARSERGTFFGVKYDFLAEFSSFFSGFWNSHSPFAQLNIIRTSCSSKHSPDFLDSLELSWNSSNFQPSFSWPSKRLKHIKQRARHPPKKYIAECKAEWEACGGFWWVSQLMIGFWWQVNPQKKNAENVGIMIYDTPGMLDIFQEATYKTIENCLINQTRFYGFTSCGS